MEYKLIASQRLITPLAPSLDPRWRAIWMYTVV